MTINLNLPEVVNDHQQEVTIKRAAIQEAAIQGVAIQVAATQGAATEEATIVQPKTNNYKKNYQSQV